MSTIVGRDRRRRLAALALALLPIGCRPRTEVKEQSPEKAADAVPAPAEYALTPASIARHGIATELVQLHRLQEAFTVPARVAFNAETMAHVGSPLRGRVVDIKVKLGSAVRTGDVLVVIDSPDLGDAQSDFLGKRSAAAASAPTTDLARSAWERAKALFESAQGVSLTEVQKREAEYRLALAAQQASAAGAAAAENRLRLLGMAPDAIAALAASGEVSGRHAIAAPVAGTVVAREVTLGDLVGPEHPSLLTLADQGTLWVLAAVPEARLRAVAVGAVCQVTAATGAPRHAGTVDLIAPSLDEATRTVQVRIEVAGGGGDLLPGMFALAEIAVAGAGSGEPELAVPEAAVQKVGGVATVFVPAAAANTFVRRPVLVGRALGGLVPILAGLAAGERVVTSGSFILKACAEQSASEGK